MSVTNELVEKAQKKAKIDQYQYHDYYAIVELLSDEHILARDAVRAWVKQEPELPPTQIRQVPTLPVHREEERIFATSSAYKGYIHRGPE